MTFWSSSQPAKTVLYCTISALFKLRAVSQALNLLRVTQVSIVVGYTSFNVVSGKYYMVAADFQTTGAADKTINLQDIIKGDFVGTDSASTAPEIQVWDPTLGGGVGGYVHYFFWSASKPKGESNFWAGSASKSGVPAAKAITIKCGQSVWFRCLQDCTINVAGEVVPVDTTIATLAGKYNMIANPFPTPLLLNQDKVNWLDAGLVAADSVETAPEIQVWDSTLGGGVGGYVHYFFWSASKPKGLTNFWGGSASKSAYNENLAVPVGSGFWLKYGGDTDLTFTFKQ